MKAEKKPQVKAKKKPQVKAKKKPQDIEAQIVEHMQRLGVAPEKIPEALSSFADHVLRQSPEDLARAEADPRVAIASHIIPGINEGKWSDPKEEEQHRDATMRQLAATSPEMLASAHDNAQHAHGANHAPKRWIKKEG